MTDTSKKIDALLEQEEKLLSRAVASTMQAYRKSYTGANLKDYHAAKKAYEDFQAKKAAQKDPGTHAFKPILEVLEYLQNEGYKVGKSKLYEDQHKIVHQKDGSMLKKDIDKYASMFLNKLDGSNYEFDAAEKYKWDTKIAEQKFKDMEFEAQIKQGLYILRSDVEQQLAARAAFLKDNLGSNFIHSRAPKIITILKGNPDYTPELIEFWLEQLEEVFNYYSKPMRFEAPAMITNEEELKEDE